MNQIETFYGVIETTADALRVFELCRQRRLVRVRRRLRDRERLHIRSGSVFVFNEAESGIRRWTDGRLWSPSRILGNFLIYRELERKQADEKRFVFKELGGLLKKTISVLLDGQTHHLICYYSKRDFYYGSLQACGEGQQVAAAELAACKIPADLLAGQSFRKPSADEIYKRSSLLEETLDGFFEGVGGACAGEEAAFGGGGGGAAAEEEQAGDAELGRARQLGSSRGSLETACLFGGGSCGDPTLPCFQFGDAGGGNTAPWLPASEAEAEFGYVADTLARLTSTAGAVGGGAKRLAPITGNAHVGRLPPLGSTLLRRRDACDSAVVAAAAKGFAVAAATAGGGGGQAAAYHQLAGQPLFPASGTAADFAYSESLCKTLYGAGGGGGGASAC